ncbi:MAG: ankyrin repeat domain-containing protein [Novosphingobium sp.]
MPKVRMLSLALSFGVPGAALALLSAPAAAQFSDSYKFLEAVKKKEGETVTEMLDKGSPNLINTRDLTSGESALHLVTQRRDLTWMQFLIAKGANVNNRDTRGVTPLVIACNLNFVEGAELLIKSGARVDESNNSGETPLITAVHNRNLPLIRLLLQAGADPDRADNSGRSARDYAKLGGHSAILSTIASDAKPRSKAGQGQSYGPKL